MYNSSSSKVAIIDYGMGNLFSVKRACEIVDLKAKITNLKKEILEADAIILPGVGAFGDAMDALRRLGLVDVLQGQLVSSKIFVGICLGMQLLMSESSEFGHHKGLGIIKGSVVRFDNPLDESGKTLKVPQVGWNRIYKTPKKADCDCWTGALLEGLNDGEFMYFVHSFYVIPNDQKVILSTSNYGNIKFCSSLNYRNIFAYQFHPERSGTQGLVIYRNLAVALKNRLLNKLNNKYV